MWTPNLRRAVAACLLAVAAAAAMAQGSPRPVPAFVDAFDTVTVWLPQARPLEALRGQVSFRVDGQVVPVRRIEGGERATRANDPNFVVLPGTLQRALGGSEWDPAGSITRMTPVGDGLFEFVATVPAGRWEYKVARGGSWAENWGAGFAPNGDNIVLELPEPRIVRFLVDFGARTVHDSINHPREVQAPVTVPTRPDFDREERDRGYQSVRVRLARDLTPRELTTRMTVGVGAAPVRPVIARGVLDDPVFYYPKDDLGSRWTATQTTFKVWSPVATEMRLALFPSATAPAQRMVPMRRGTAGVWYVTVPGNLHGVYYQYHLASYGQRRVAADIYGFAASADSSRSMVVNLAKTNPPGWPAPRLFRGLKHTDAVVYEAHIRDFTIHPQSGIRQDWRGKYLGFTQTGTRVPGSTFPTGLDYLKDLGVTHIHLLPFQDFNAAHSQMYNWGYETTLFNVPEEQYAIDRHDTLGRIRETKQMILALQRAGIGVVLDVVYNHSVPSEGPLSAFWELAPWFYFRTNDRGDVLNESGVGNALHDERPMVRKFIRESLEYWTREYRLDGYRFDLIGMFTRETNMELARAIRRLHPDAVLYGEPWTGGGPVRFGKGAQRGTGIAVFNDRFRGAFRGELDGASPGFSMGGLTDRNALIRSIMGSVDDFTDSPQETTNYVSSHDNLTFRDRVSRSLPDASPATQERAVRLAHAAVLLSQGMPFLEGGVQLGRTKGMNSNSYNAGDEANQYDWPRALRFRDTHAYFRGLIALRRAHPAFRLRTADQIRRLVTFLPEAQTPAGAIAFRIDGARAGDRWREIVVVLHGSMAPARMVLPPGAWNVVVDARTAGTRSLRHVEGAVEVEPLSTLVLVR